SSRVFAGRLSGGLVAAIAAATRSFSSAAFDASSASVSIARGGRFNRMPAARPPCWARVTFMPVVYVTLDVAANSQLVPFVLQAGDLGLQRDQLPGELLDFPCDRG